MIEPQQDTQQEPPHIFEALQRVALKLEQIPDCLKQDVQTILEYLWYDEQKDYRCNYMSDDDDDDDEEQEDYESNIDS